MPKLFMDLDCALRAEVNFLVKVEILHEDFKSGNSSVKTLGSVSR